MYNTFPPTSQVLPFLSLMLKLPCQVQIGCHTDNLTNAKKLFRAPVVTHRCCMDRTKRSVSCLWGGLLYVIVPKGSNLGPVSLTVSRAVPAPYYKLGKSVDCWGRASCGCFSDCWLIAIRGRQRSTVERRRKNCQRCS